MAVRNSAKKAAKKKSGAVVSNKVGNYEKHPFFVKKKAAARAFLDKVGIPEAMVKKTAHQ